MWIITAIRNSVQRHWAFLLPFVLFSLLLLRNPYSDRNLISNLEPYPDSIHYISPALGLVQGQGFMINREGRELLPGVPPLYSLTLTLGFILNQDVRTFYFVNIMLALTSFGLFYLIISKITPNTFFQFLVLSLFATNFTLYWFPMLAMAENLILPLILGAIYILMIPFTRKSAFLIGAISASFYAAKFASLPLSVAVPFLYFLKVLFSKQSKNKKNIFLSFFISLGIWGGAYLLYEYVVRNNNLVGGLLGLFWAMFAPKKVMSAVSGGPQSGGFFSLQYIGSNLSAYGRWLLGDPIYILWKNIAIMPKYLAIIAWMGSVGSLFTKRRAFALMLLVLLAFNMLFMMTFYAADGRYFIIAIPIMLLNLALCFSFIQERLKGNGKSIAYAAVVLACLVAGASSLKRVKFDVMLNLRHAETPWYHISITTFDSYLKDHSSEFAKEPVVISALPPYLVDFYSTQKSILLPLSPGQEFQTHKIKAWGEHDYTHLPQEYARYFADGHPVFLTSYGLGNEKYLHEAFDSLLAQFTFKKVQDGCYTLCDVYQMIGTLPASKSAQTKK